MQVKVHRILLVDDDFDQQLLSQHALKKALPAGSTIQLAASGHDAIRYLLGEPPYSDRRQFPFPTLIITDLSMADGDGFDVLEFLKNNPAWSVVPRIMFSSSADDDDVRTAFLLGVSAYHLKPSGADALIACMRSMLEYWTSSEVPPVDETGRLLLGKSGRRGTRYPPPQGGGSMERPE